MTASHINASLLDIALYSPLKPSHDSKIPYKIVNHTTDSIMDALDKIQISEEQKYNLAQSDDEIFDIYPPPPSSERFNCIITSGWGDTYFPSPTPTGLTKTRRLIHREGDWHRSVQVWIVQKVVDGGVRVLLQRRSKYKDTHPNMLDVSCAGHVDSGEDVVETALRELQEELGGNGNVQYTRSDLEQNKEFVVTSSMKGETQNYGSFICNEYQDVFILWWKDDTSPIDSSMFAPKNREEVSGFEIVKGQDLIQRMRAEDESLVPRCSEYVDALARAFGLQ